MSSLITAQSKSFHAKRLVNFWESRWKDRRDIKDLVEMCNTHKAWYSAPLVDRSDYSPAPLLLKDMIRKLFLEDTITLRDAVELWEQLKSDDEEVRYVALNLLRIKAPTRFIQPGHEEAVTGQEKSGERVRT